MLALKKALRGVLGDTAAAEVGRLGDALMRALGDRRPAPDDTLPETRVGRERERLLSPAFIRAWGSAARAYCPRATPFWR